MFEFRQTLIFPTSEPLNALCIFLPSGTFGFIDLLSFNIFQPWNSTHSEKRPWLIFPNKHSTYSKISLVVAGAKWPLHPACPCALTTYRAQVPTWWVEGGRATVMSCPLPLLFLLRLWCQVRFRGWALLQGGELTEGGTCPGPLPRQWRTPPSVLRRICLYRSLCFCCLDVTIHSFAWGDFLTSLSLLLVVQNLPVRKLNGSQGGQRFYFTIPLQN